MPEILHVFLVATEPSGDALGASLMRGLKEKLGGAVRFSGVAGPLMEGEGMRSLFPQSDLTVFGFFEVLPKIPIILKRMRETVTAALAAKPDVVVTIDGPDFSFRVAKQLKGHGIKLVHYVAPTVWAWRKGRAKKIARIYDHLLVLFGFEPPYFEKEGLPCTFVGHPASQHVPHAGDKEEFRKAFNIPENKKILCVLPGSRRGEIKMLTPIYGKVIEKIYDRIGQPVVIIPAVSTVHELLMQKLEAWKIKPIVFTDRAMKHKLFAASHAALATSGTVTLELAVTDTPHLVAQRMSYITVLLYIGLAFIKFFNLVNIFVQKEVVPECIQLKCTPGIIAPTLEKIWNDNELRQQQRVAFAETRRQLQPPGGTPSAMAAEAVCKVVGRAS